MSKSHAAEVTACDVRLDRDANLSSQHVEQDRHAITPRCSVEQP
jgi:hypothetical protein